MSLTDRRISQIVRSPNKQWWAYRHVNGGIHLKRFYDQSDVEEAYASDFVEDVLDPFEADTRDEATQIVKQTVGKRWCGVRPQKAVGK